VPASAPAPPLLLFLHPLLARGRATRERQRERERERGEQGGTEEDGGEKGAYERVRARRANERDGNNPASTGSVRADRGVILDPDGFFHRRCPYFSFHERDDDDDFHPLP